MKLLTIVIPCYNSAAYMKKAITSAVSGGDEVDVLVVDDGSADATGAIADEFAAAYPDIVRVIHQENGGHGEGINQGIRQGLGLYLKVLDSDDRLDPHYLPGFLDLIRRYAGRDDQPDLIIHDYVYDSSTREANFRIGYRNALRPNVSMTWDEIRPFLPSNQFMIHCMAYRTAMLRDEMHLVLPKHIFYEDNLYIYQPLPYVKRLAYYNRPLHAYFVGRSDQSINADVIVRRVRQVTDIAIRMICTYSLTELDKLPKRLRGYMLNNLCGQLSSCCSTQFMAGEEGLRQYDRLCAAIRDFDPSLWKKLHHMPLGRIATPKTPFGRWMLVFFLKVGQRMLQFN